MIVDMTAGVNANGMGVLDTPQFATKAYFPDDPSRALPDHEIKAGTPIPAVVPMPMMAMAPQPSAKVEIAYNNVGEPTGAWQKTDGSIASKPPVCNLSGFEKGQGNCLQTTVQRWYADDVTNNIGQDRTLRTVFTHDHFGPSTHQHPGLYAGVVIEPVGSMWKHNETGTALGTRTDGGPTTWQAIVEPGNGQKPYREFLLEMGDFSLAYRPDGTPC